MTFKVFDWKKEPMNDEYLYVGLPIFNSKGDITEFWASFIRKKEIKSIEPFYFEDVPDEEACYVYLYKDKWYLVLMDSESLVNFINDKIL